MMAIGKLVIVITSLLSLAVCAGNLSDRRLVVRLRPSTSNSITFSRDTDAYRDGSVFCDRPAAEQVSAGTRIAYGDPITIASDLEGEAQRLWDIVQQHPLATLLGTIIWKIRQISHRPVFTQTGLSPRRLKSGGEAVAVFSGVGVAKTSGSSRRNWIQEKKDERVDRLSSSTKRS